MANFPIRGKAPAKVEVKKDVESKYDTVGFARIRKRKKDGAEFIAISMISGEQYILSENTKYDPEDKNSFAYFVNKAKE
jgi:hypothetical protein